MVVTSYRKPICASKTHWQLSLFLLLAPFINPAFATQNNPIRQDLMNASLEELMNVKISTVFRKPQTLQETAAAVFVISQEDIRRSSANSIPELLRMAPGLSVARIDSNKWSVTSRGYSGRFADDLLVMIDGRTVYSPLFAGTFWETLDLPLEDIDRIEVIRGPGGTIWGANAVNGAINIITKHTKATQGNLITTGGGSEERGFATFRHGGRVGENLFYRFYAKGFTRDNSFNASGTNDSWRMGTLGFRADWDINTNNAVTFQAQYYAGKAGQNTMLLNPTEPESVITRPEDANLAGGHALMRWQRTTGERSNTALQVYYDRTSRNELSFRETRQTVDIDFQHRFPLQIPYIPFQPDLIWGGGYRWTTDHLGINLPISFDPAKRNLQTGNVFMQTDIPLFEDRLKLTTGIKFLDNTYAHSNFLPNARLLWTPDDKQSVWLSATRSIRLPSRFERDGNQLIRSGAEFIRLISNPHLLAETLWGFETGYRRQVTSNLSVDIAGFFNDYNNSTSERETTAETIQLTNQRKTQIFGFEIYGEWRAFDKLRFMPSYSHLQVRNHVPADHESESGEDPKHQFTLRTQLDLTKNIELDAFFRHIDKLPGLEIKSYQALDLRLSWRPRSDTELTLVGQNLLQSHHQEFSPEVIQTMPVQIQRGVFGKVTWRF
ncbi:MAG TPA: TonB-dependent receptor [Nitrosomonas sp.]|nr:TonB-dependent receptor [Nitrosomonas sp.]